MRQLLRAHCRLTIAWLIVAGITAVLAVLTAATSVPPPVTYAILLLAAAKVAVVMSEFMELRMEPKGWRIAAAAWLVAVSAILLVTFT